MNLGSDDEKPDFNWAGLITFLIIFAFGAWALLAPRGG